MFSLKFINKYQILQHAINFNDLVNFRIIVGTSEPPTQRFNRLLQKIRCTCPEANVSIETRNTFPTAAGLASSASGYAALACSLKLLYPEKSTHVSELARLGSGSACRSTMGGFVQWDLGVSETGSDSVARQLFPVSHWQELRLLVCVVCRDEKGIPSTAGMQNTVRTSDLLHHRLAHVGARAERITRAISNRNFSEFGELTMRDSNEMHAVCLDTFPPINYLSDTSHQIIRAVHQFNEQKGALQAAYTFDAGPNAVLFCEECDVVELREMVERDFCDSGKVSEVIECEVGCGPVVLVK